MSSVYVMDTSALIDAWVRYYPPDVFPPLWEHFDEMAASGEFVIPQEVHGELRTKEDALYTWVDRRAEAMVQPTTTQTMESARDILARFPGLTKTGRGRGLADPWVIALAGTIDCTVVTAEQGGSVTKPRIPFVCGELGIECKSVLELIREQRIAFRR